MEEVKSMCFKIDGSLVVLVGSCWFSLVSKDC